MPQGIRFLLAAHVDKDTSFEETRGAMPARLNNGGGTMRLRVKGALDQCSTSAAAIFAFQEVVGILVDLVFVCLIVQGVRHGPWS